jgi:YHS domain-containing protein
MKIALIALVIFVSSVGSASVTEPLCGADSSHQADGKQAPSVFNSAQKVGAKASCPISGEEFTIAAATLHSEYKGKYVYFCCPGCKTRFDRDPEKYLSRNS